MCPVTCVFSFTVIKLQEEEEEDNEEEVEVQGRDEPTSTL